MDPLAPAAALVRIDVTAVTALLTHLRAASSQLQAVAGWLRAAPGRLSTWSGAGYDAFSAAAESASRRLGALSDALGLAALALSAFAAALAAAQDEARAASRIVRVAGPTDPAPAVAAELTAVAARYRAADLRAAQVLADALLLDLTRSSAAPIGARLSVPGAAELLEQDISRPPPPPSSPPAVAVWWSGLSPAVRARAAATWPGWPANVDGVPAAVRDVVNRRRLAGALDAAQAAFAAVPGAAMFARLTARARLQRLQSLAAAVRPAGTQLLLFDPRGDGEAVISTANVETSRAVAVLVPGMSNELGDMPALAAEARRLATAAGSGTAVVAWLGYDAPNVRQVVNDARARAGAPQLQSFVLGLRATATRLQQVTVLGHSYGSLVAGLAAKRGLGVDDLVLLASPGVEANRASQLHLRPGHVWAARDATDPIQLVFWPARLGALFGLDLPSAFGPDPAAAPFGAKHFPDGGAYGHSGYFASGSQSLASLAAIVSRRSLP